MREEAKEDEVMERALQFMEEFLADEEIKNVYDKINDVERNAREEEKMKTAKNLLQLNIAIEDISKATGLSIKELENLNACLEEKYLELSYLFDIMKELELQKDTGNYGYPVYYAVDSYYRYTINISKDETKITDISVVSLDGTVSYLLTFSNLEE